MFRDAMIEELVESTPCVLSDAHLPSAKDKDPELRDTAVFSLAEVATLVSDPASRKTAAAATRSTSSGAAGSARRPPRAGACTSPTSSPLGCCASPAGTRRG